MHERGGAMLFGFGLSQVELGSLAALEAIASERDVRDARFERASRDREALVEVA
jgi:hypothetical protein